MRVTYRNVGGQRHLGTPQYCTDGKPPLEGSAKRHWGLARNNTNVWQLLEYLTRATWSAHQLASSCVEVSNHQSATRRQLLVQPYSQTAVRGSGDPPRPGLLPAHQSPLSINTNRLMNLLSVATEIGLIAYPKPHTPHQHHNLPDS